MWAGHNLYIKERDETQNVNQEEDSSCQFLVYILKWESMKPENEPLSKLWADHADVLSAI